MGVILNDIHRAQSMVRVAGARGPLKFRCHPSVVMDLARDLPLEMATGFLVDPAVLGMDIVEDEYLSPGAWRITDEFDTLLWDCRMGPPR